MINFFGIAFQNQIIIVLLQTRVRPTDFYLFFNSKFHANAYECYTGHWSKSNLNNNIFRDYSTTKTAKKISQFQIIPSMAGLGSSPHPLYIRIFERPKNTNIVHNVKLENPCNCLFLVCENEIDCGYFIRTVLQIKITMKNECKMWNYELRVKNISFRLICLGLVYFFSPVFCLVVNENAWVGCNIVIYMLSNRG